MDSPISVGPTTWWIIPRIENRLYSHLFQWDLCRINPLYLLGYSLLTIRGMIHQALQSPSCRIAGLPRGIGDAAALVGRFDGLGQAEPERSAGGCSPEEKPWKSYRVVHQ